MLFSKSPSVPLYKRGNTLTIFNFLYGKLVKKYLLFFWLALVSIFYFQNYPFPRAGEVIAALALLFLLIIISWAIGRYLLRKLQLKVDVLEEFILAAGLGLGGISLLVFFQGLARLYYSWVGCAGIILLIVVLHKELKAIYRILRGAANSVLRPSGQPLSWTESLPIVLVLFVVGISAFYALAPSTYYDALVYHLACPQVYLRAHRFLAIVENFYGYFPQNMEMLYTIALQFGSDLLVHFIHGCFGWLTAAAIFVFGRRWFNRQVGIWSALIFLSAPMVMLLSTGAMIDLGLSFFVFLSLIAFCFWWETDEFNWLILSGIFSGLALGCKYTAGTPALIFYIAFLVKRLVVGDGSKPSLTLIFLKEAVIYGLTILLTFSPWLIKNIVFTGNPVFPFLYEFFGGPIEPQNLKLIVAHTGIGQLIREFFYPALLTGSQTGGFDIFGDFGWGNFLIFLPGIFFIKSIPRKILLLCGFAGLILLWLTFSRLLFRYFVYLWPVLGLLSGWCFVTLGREYPLIKPINFLIFLLMFLSGLYMVFEVQNSINPYRVILGLETKEQYLTRILPYYPAVDFMNRNLPKTSLILFRAEGRGYYSERNYIPCNYFALDPLMRIANKVNSAQGIEDFLKKEKITHLFFQDQQKEWETWRKLNEAHWTEKGRITFAEFKKKHLRLIFKKEKISELYELI